LTLAVARSASAAPCSGKDDAAHSAERARRYGSIAALAVIVLFALGGLFLWIGVGGYRISSDISPIGPSNPLLKTVALEKG
ncbi:hypothetical protein AB9E03_34030, partial [Rhizobium leguminosarum]